MSKKGFTLIELMVVISIIAILSAVGIVAFSKAQLAGRDARRKNDLRSIAQALSLFYSANRHYPYQNDWGGSVIGVYDMPWPSQFTTVMAPFMAQLPHDPTNSWPYIYAYSYNTGNGGDYHLCAKLENLSDPDINVPSGTSCTRDGNTFANFMVASP